jgi:MerR family transcriptional regulator, heat shock protein HspR
MTQPLDDENVPLFTVGQVAELLAVKQAFLRRCDELRVVSPQRSAGGQRRYTRVEIRVIQQVVSMADEGMTLPAIRRIIELEERLVVVTRQRDELARRLVQLTGGQLTGGQPAGSEPSPGQTAKSQDARSRTAGS